MKTVWLYTVTLAVTSEHTSEVKVVMGLVTAADQDEAKSLVRANYMSRPACELVRVKIHDHIGLD